MAGIRVNDATCPAAIAVYTTPRIARNHMRRPYALRPAGDRDRAYVTVKAAQLRQRSDPTPAGPRWRGTAASVRMEW